MILDQYGRPLPELQPNRPRPRSGRWLLDDPNDRNYTDVSRDLSPERIDSIMGRANQGDAADQAELANLLLEKNHEIKHAFSVRVNSILGLKYTVEPGDDDSPEARSAAEAFHVGFDVVICLHRHQFAEIVVAAHILVSVFYSPFRVSSVVQQPVECAGLHFFRLGGILADFLQSG